MIYFCDNPSCERHIPNEWSWPWVRRLPNGHFNLRMVVDYPLLKNLTNTRVYEVLCPRVSVRSEKTPWGTSRVWLCASCYAANSMANDGMFPEFDQGSPVGQLMGASAPLGIYPGADPNLHVLSKPFSWALSSAKKPYWIDPLRMAVNPQRGVLWYDVVWAYLESTLREGNPCRLDSSDVEGMIEDGGSWLNGRLLKLSTDLGMELTTIKDSMHDYSLITPKIKRFSVPIP